MPVTNRLISEGCGLLRVISGVVVAADMRGAVADTRSLLPEMSVLTHVLVDMSDVSDFQVTSSELREVADRLERFAAETPSLITAVAAPEDVSFGMSRMFEAWSSRPGWTVGVFRSLAEAEDWLRKEVPEYERA